MIKAVIFDYGGVIGSNPIGKTYEAVSAEFGVSVGKIRKEYVLLNVPAQKDAITEEYFWEAFSEKLVVMDAARLKSVWMRNHQSNRSINDGVVSIVKCLKKRGYKLGVLSNLPNIYKEYLKDDYVLEMFDASVHSFEVGSRKDEKKIYDETVRRLGVKYRDCVIVDDQEEHLRMPEELGFRTVHFVSAEQLKADLSAILPPGKRVRK